MSVQQHTSAALYPGKDPVPIEQEAGWAPGLVWTGEKSHHHRDSIPDRPASSHSLCRLSYPVHFISIYKRILRYNASRFMSLENEFLLLYTYWYSKISFTTCGAFRKHFPHKMLPTDFRIILALFKHSNT